MKKFCILSFGCGLFATSFWLLACVYLSLPAYSTQHSALSSQSLSCQQQDIETLTNQLLNDLPSYANRVIQRARSINGKIVDFYNYVIIAGRPEFEPLTLGPGVYKPADSVLGSQQPQQVFITTLERQYTAGKAVKLQQYHWLFFTQTSSGWQLAMMFTRTGPYSGEQPPTPPEETSNGDIAQAINEWLRDCQAKNVKND